MFQDKIEVHHHQKVVDGKIEVDYFEVKIFAPNGKDLKDILTIPKIDVSLLIEKLQAIT